MYSLKGGKQNLFIPTRAMTGWNVIDFCMAVISGPNGMNFLSRSKHPILVKILLPMFKSGERERKEKKVLCSDFLPSSFPHFIWEH